jgi:hypothetical protein
MAVESTKWRIHVISYSSRRINVLEFHTPGRKMLKVVFQCDSVYPDPPFGTYCNFIRYYWVRVALWDSLYRVFNSTTAQHDRQVKHLGLKQQDLPTNYCSDTQNLSYLSRTLFSSRTAYSVVEPLAEFVILPYFSIDNANIMYNAHPNFFYIPFDV